jgi:mono/diheme cytochrome c family protein
MAAFSLAATALAFASPLAAGRAESMTEAIEHFESTVLPILEARCFECHGPAAKRAKGGLRLDGTDSLLEGGVTGPAVVPGDPEGSLLIDAIHWNESGLEMPPDGRLTGAEIAALERWVEQGAPWPESTTPAAPPDSAESGDATGASPIDVVAGREWWAFREPVSPPAPADGAAGASPTVDAFLEAKLAAAGIAPAPEADLATLIRRACFVLTGLPPTSEEVARFVAGGETYEQLVERLLARPEYGERWARHWLDVVRYAETSGYERDERKPMAWRYRDWVIDAFNADMPFDRFVVEQIAGDEIESPTASSRIATGFLRLGTFDSEPDDAEQARLDDLDDVIGTISEGFLGLTVGCARCHDHKFDPIAQTDYYGLLGFVQNLRRSEAARFDPSSSILEPVGADEADLTRWQADRERAKAAIERRFEQERRHSTRRVHERRLRDAGADPGLLDIAAARRTPQQQGLVRRVQNDAITREEITEVLGEEYVKSMNRLRGELAALELSFEGDLDWALVAKEEGPLVTPTHLRVRGEARQLGEEVVPHFPRVLFADDAAATPALVVDPSRPTSGRRRVLAEWIASPTNPLTARVLVNRVWQHHFGRGIVATPNDFGSAGEPPTHPELLDWLAAEFVKNGSSMKWLHRTILRSAAFRRSSRDTVPEAARRDPANLLLWRQNPRRVEAEVVRDSLLAASDSLVPTRGGASFFAPLERAVLASSSRPGEGHGVSTEEATRRRSIYAYAKRNLQAPLLEAFDAANSSLPTACRAITTVAPQALVLLNGRFAGEAAERLAAKVLTEVGDSEVAQVRRVFERVLSRPPQPEEARVAIEFLRRSYAAFASDELRLRIAARIPRRVEVDYLAALSGEHVLAAPRAIFTILRGRFGNEYNKTVESDPLAGPAALWNGVSLVDGEVTARLRLVGDAPYGSLLLRAGPSGDGVRGFELRLEPGTGSEAGMLRLIEHAAPKESPAAAGGAGLPATTREWLATPGPIASDRWIELRVTLAGDRLAVHLDGGAEPILVASLPGPRLAKGRIGFATHGDGIELASLVAKAGNESHEMPIAAAPPGARALAALALTVFNLNEFVTVD